MYVTRLVGLCAWFDLGVRKLDVRLISLSVCLSCVVFVVFFPLGKKKPRSFDELYYSSLRFLLDKRFACCMSAIGMRSGTQRQTVDVGQSSFAGRSSGSFECLLGSRGLAWDRGKPGGVNPLHGEYVYPAACHRQVVTACHKTNWRPLSSPTTVRIGRGASSHAQVTIFEPFPSSHMYYIFYGFAWRVLGKFQNPNQIIINYI